MHITASNDGVYFNYLIHRLIFLCFELTFHNAGYLNFTLGTS